MQSEVPRIEQQETDFRDQLEHESIGSKEEVLMTARLCKTTFEENASRSGRRDRSEEENISMLTDEERIRITEALQQWAEQAPSDELVIEFGGGDRFLTPFQVSIEVERNTPDGQAILRILEDGVREEGLQQIVNRLTDKGI
jgi:hypothetical protein